MYQHSRLNTNRFGFIQKFKNFDYILLTCILMLGFISLATMYSTDGGKILFHTKSHFTKLIVFTLMMLIISLIFIPNNIALIGITKIIGIQFAIQWEINFEQTISSNGFWVKIIASKFPSS